MYLHIHVIPRFRGDSISKLMEAMLRPRGFEKAAREDLDEIRKKIEKIFRKIDAKA